MPRFVRLTLAALFACFAAGCGGSTPPVTVSAPPFTAPTGAITRGEVAFNATCAACHGPRGRGTTTGPPLVHDYYKPSHHADAAFLLAVRNGVVQHHWGFGNMPAQPQVTNAEVGDIVAYVRAIQREAGIR